MSLLTSQQKPSYPFLVVAFFTSLAYACVWIAIAATPVKAQITNHSVSKKPRQVTISWSSAEDGSELRWDTKIHNNFNDFPSNFPNNVSNTESKTNQSNVAGKYRHSRTISDLSAGTYWYMVRSGTDIAGPFTLEIAESEAGWPVENLVPLKGKTPGKITQSTFIKTASTEDTGKLWLAGDFDRIGKISPPALSINTSGNTEPGAPVISGGSVETTTDDGEGGWYIGGSFTKVAGIPMRGVAHILPDGGVDTAFNVDGFADGATVYALEYDGINSPKRLYVGGLFTYNWDEGGVKTNNNLTALNPENGKRLTQNQFNIGTGTSGAGNLATLGEVRTIVADQRVAQGAKKDDNAGVYIGGRFTKASGANFSKIAKLEPTGEPAEGKGECVSGALCFIGEWFANVKFASPAIKKDGSEADAIVYSLAYWDPRYVGEAVVGTTARYQPILAVGGDFDSIEVAGGSALEASNFTLVDSLLGSQLGPLGVGGKPHGPTGKNAASNGVVRSLQVVDSKVGYVGSANYTNDKLYIGGDFTNFYGQNRNGTARLSMNRFLNNDDNTPWILDDFNPLKEVNSFSSVTYIYTQCFSSISGPIKSYIHCGTSPSNHNNPSIDQPGVCESVYIAGNFHYTNNTNGQRYDHLARTDCEGSSLDTNFKPGQALNEAPKSLAYSSGKRLFVGGDFSMYEGKRRPGIVAFDVTNGKREFSEDFEHWEKGVTKGSDSGTISSMSSNGDTLFIGGDFDKVEEEPRTNVAEISGSNVTSFNPSPNGKVNTILAPPEATHHNRVWLGGEFTQTNSCASAGLTCKHLAFLDTNNGDPLNGVADPTPNPNDQVRTIIANDTGSNVFVGGDFTQVGSKDISVVAKFDDSGHLIEDSFNNRSSESGDRVTALAYNNNSLYLGGLDQWNGQAAHGLIKIDAATGDIDDNFQVNLGSPINENTVRDLEVSNNRLVVGGAFSSYNGDQNQQYIATADLNSGKAISGFSPKIEGDDPLVTTITTIGSQTIIGGNIGTFEGISDRGGLVSLPSPLDIHEPYIGVKLSTIPPSEDNYVVPEDKDNIRMVIPAPKEGEDNKRIVHVDADVHDSYTLNDATYSTTSGIDTFTFSGMEAPWAPNDSQPETVGSRGLSFECKDDNGDKLSGLPKYLPVLKLPTEVEATTAKTCSWGGYIVRPNNGTGRVRFEAAGSGQVLLDTKNIINGTELEFDKPIKIFAEWQKGSGEPPSLKWTHDLTFSYKQVPEAAYVQSAPFERNYVIDSPNKTEDFKLIELNARDKDFNSRSIKIKVAVDGEKPNISSLTSSPKRNTTGTYSSNSIKMNVATGADVGPAGLKSQTLWRRYLPINQATADCKWGSNTDTSIELGDTPVTNTSSSNWASTLTDNLSDGCYQFKIVAIDNVGNSTTSSIDGIDLTTDWIKIDTSNPGGNISTPHINEVVSGSNVQMSGDLDKSGMSSIISTKLSYENTDKTVVGSVNGCSPNQLSTAWSCTWDSKIVPDGKYTLKLEVENASGKKNIIPIVTNITVDNYAPIVTDIDIQEIEGQPYQFVEKISPNTSILWLNPSKPGKMRTLISVDDKGSGTKSITFPNSIVTLDSGDIFNGKWVFEKSWSNLQPLLQSVSNIVITDKANHTTNASLEIKHDTEPPSGLLSNFLAGSVTDGVTNSVQIQFTPGSDTGSGIESYWIERVKGDNSPAGCINFPPFTNRQEDRISALNPNQTNVFTDDTTVVNTCYRYRLLVQDHVGNIAYHDTGAVITSSAEVIYPKDIKVAEGSPPATAAISLRARPSIGEVVTITAFSGDQTTISTPSPTLVFTHDDWNTKKDIQVLATDDNLVEDAEHHGNILLTVNSTGTSLTPRYTSSNILVPVTVLDNDTAGIEVQQTETIPIKEGSETASIISIRLIAQPNSDVRIGGYSSTGRLTSSAVTITPSEWNSWHNIEVRAVDDLIANKTQNESLQLRAENKALHFTDINANLTFNVTDNDTAQLIFTPGDKWVPRANGSVPIIEGSDGIKFSIKAATKPRADVVLVPVISDTTHASISPTSIVIAAGQDPSDTTFTVKAKDNSIPDEEYAAKIGWRIESADELYTDLLPSLKTINLAIVDDGDKRVEPVREIRETTPPREPTRYKSPYYPQENFVQQPAPNPAPPVYLPPVTELKDAIKAETPKAPKAERVENKSGISNWVRENKGTAAVASGVAFLGIAKLLTGFLHNMPGGLGRLFGVRGSVAARKAKSIITKTRNGGTIIGGGSGDKTDKRKAKVDKKQDVDILEHLESKYEATYEDPLDSLNNPKASYEDPLERFERNYKNAS